MQIPCLCCESSLWVWGQDSAFQQTGWLMWGWAGGGPDLQGTRASSCRLWSLSSDSCVPSMFSTQGPTSSSVYRAQLLAWVREVHTPWLVSHTHPFLMCQQGAHSAARADPGAWSPAWSRPDQKEDDSLVSSTSLGPGNSRAPKAM